MPLRRIGGTDCGPAGRAMPSSAAGLAGSAVTDDGADATGKLSGVALSSGRAESVALVASGSASDAGVAAARAAVVCVAGGAAECGDDAAPVAGDERKCETAEPTRTMAMTAAASIAMRRAVGRYHQGSKEPATAAMSVVTRASAAIASAASALIAGVCTRPLERVGVWP